MTRADDITKILDGALDAAADDSDGTVGMIVVGYGTGLMIDEGYTIDQIREAINLMLDDVRKRLEAEAN
mgnify:CR=1 FL=1